MTALGDRVRARRVGVRQCGSSRHAAAPTAAQRAVAERDRESDQPDSRASTCRTAARSPGRSTTMPPNFNYNELDGTLLDDAVRHRRA